MSQAKKGKLNFRCPACFMRDIDIDMFYDEEKKESDRYQQKHPLYKTYKSISGWLTLGIYLVVSFATGAWYITWLIFPISACIDSVIKAILDLQEVHKP
jgi:hypothetical protein